MRDFNKEFLDTATRIYMHDFDYAMRRYMLRTFDPFFKPGNALEVGCYKGDFTEMLAAVFQDLTVVEASSELASFTQGRLGDKVNVIHSLIEDAPMDTQYEHVFLIHTLEHIDDSVSALTKCRKLLTESGRFFVAVPNAYAASRQIAVKMGLIPHNAAVTSGEYEHGHRRTYTFDTLEQEIRLAGMRPIQRGGLIFKALANFQIDRAMQTGIIDTAYLEGCYQLGMQYPELCASIYFICEKDSC